MKNYKRRMLRLFASCPLGVADLLAGEITPLGARRVRTDRAGVRFEGDLACAYRVCLWSRLASRVMLQLKQFDSGDNQQLYAGVQDIDWQDHLPPGDSTLAVNFTGTNEAIRNTHFGTLKVKDAIVDQLRAATGTRPSIAKYRPDIRVNLHLQGARATLSLDLSGEPLHQRGYRRQGGPAPLKENLAAALLLRADWPKWAAQGGRFTDPLCGSGTLVIEAALLAMNIAPGLAREYFGFLAWRGHDQALWRELCEEAQGMRRDFEAPRAALAGYDADARAVEAALTNARAAGVAEQVEFQRLELQALEPAKLRARCPGLLLTNPPYGTRLGEVADHLPLYRLLGERIREVFDGCDAWVFSADQQLLDALGAPAARSHRMFNGPLECRLVKLAASGQGTAVAAPEHHADDALVNRLHKNMRRLRGWLKQEGIECFRLYDADLPEYAFALDVYRTETDSWLLAQEYAPPAQVDPRAVARRRDVAVRSFARALEVEEGQVLLRERRPQRGAAQYEKHAEQALWRVVREGGCRFRVNLSDYLDTGLFLDHRPTRALVASMADGGRLLNLFAYTASATVYGAAGGAVESLSIDLSHTYQDWARRNFELNGLDLRRHRLLRADCLQWLQEPGDAGRFDLIFLDPPTFSTSKAMRSTLDIQRDHVALIQGAARLLSARGRLLFSTNRRDFVMDRSALSLLRLEDISRQTLPRDFARNPRVHQTWLITQPGT